MSLFKQLSTEGLEEQNDYLGGGGAIDSDIYIGMIKVAYLITSKEGANAAQLILGINGGEVRETIYITNKKGENYFIKDGKRIPLPGFTTIDNLCLIVTGNPLADQEDSVEEKVVNVYDYDLKKEVTKSVPVLTELTGKPIAVAISKVLENKNKKDNSGNYVATEEERTYNQIEAIFHPDLKLTVAEARDGKDVPAFWDAWLKRNKGVIRDKRTIKDGVSQGGAAGKPGSKNAGAPPTSGAAATGGRKSLFGAKS